MESNQKHNPISNSGNRRFSQREPRDRIIFLLRLFLPIIIFIGGIMIIRYAPYILPDKPIWQKDSVGGLFLVYAIFRVYQAFTRYSRKDEE